MRKPFSTLTHNVIAMKNCNFCLIFSESELDTRIPNLLKLETTSDHPFYTLAYFNMCKAYFSTSLFSPITCIVSCHTSACLQGKYRPLMVHLINY